MKRIYIILAIISLSFISCEIKEEITFNEDGSGEVYIGYNMDKMLEEFPNQSKNKKNKKPIDSIIDFAKIMEDPKFKDSIAKIKDVDKASLETLKNLKMRIVADEANKKMEFGFYFAFKRIDSVQDIFNTIKKAKKITKQDKKTEMVKDKPVFNSLSGENQKILYSYNGNVFTRNVKLKKKISDKDNKEINKSITNDKDPFGKIANSLKYTIVLNFPKKIKKINNKDAVFSNHKKTATISYSLEDYMLHPEKLNLKVKLAK